MKSTNYVTIQRTAKRYKVMKLFAVILFGLSILGSVNSAPSAPAMFLISIALGIIAKIGIWWDHA